MHPSHKKKSSVAGARVPNTGPIIPPGVGGIPSTGNLYEPLAGLGTNKDQSLQEGHPLERRTTSRERWRRRSLNEYVINFSNESCTEDGIPVIVDSSKKGVTGTEASEGSNPLHGASVPLPLGNISGVELVGGAPGGAPATSSTQITTPLIHLDENSLNLRGKNTGNEGQNNIGDTSDEDEDKYYTDTENQDSEVVNGTVLQGSPGTISTDGITALPNILTENLRPNPDPKFKSTAKKSVNESELKDTNTSSMDTPDAPEIVTNTLVDEHRNITVPTIIVDDTEDAGKDDKSKPEVSPKSNIDLTERADKSPPILSGFPPLLVMTVTSMTSSLRSFRSSSLRQARSAPPTLRMSSSTKATGR